MDPMVREDVRKMLALSAQADKLADLYMKSRITKEEYDCRLEELRQQCSFGGIEIHRAWE
jgi:hypothetical protein